MAPLVPAAGAESRLDVTAGYAGFHVPRRALPVQVTVTAERLVKGELVVKESGTKREATLPVEVAGGSVKRFTVVLPGGVTASNGAVDVELRAGGRALGRGRADVKAADDAELVGLGPQLVEGRSLPGPAALAVDAGVARFAALDAGLLAQAPASLDGLSAVALAPGELGALAPGVRAGLLRWVGGGGHLLIDEPPGTALDGLPAEWQPAPAFGRVAAGLGEVRLTGDAMTAGRWAGLIEPSSVARNDSGGFFSPESVADSLARDAGLRLPRLPWLLGFLGVYIAVVGPVTGLVLRWRRRPDLAWVVVPGLAVVFTVLAYVAGNQLRPGAGLAHGSIVETGTSGPVATSWVALTRRTAGTAHVDLPQGWGVEGTVALNSQFGRCFGDGCPGNADLEAPSVGAGEAGPEVRLPLSSGEFGVFKASGPVSLPGRLEVSASSAGDGVANGTVRNGLPFAVDRVVVFVGSYRARVGRLAPGEQRSWSVGPGDRMSDPSGSEAWMSEMGFRPDGLVNFSLWQSAMGDLGQDGDPSGQAMAVGWTRDWKPTVTVDGNERQAPGRTAIVGRAPVAPTGGRVTDLVVAADVVRGPSLNPFRGRWAGNNPGQASVVKLTLPPGRADRRLVLQTSLTLTDVAVWHNGAWRHLDVPFGINGMDALLRKRAIAIGGGGVVFDAVPPPTTTTAPAPPPAQMFTTTTAPAPSPPGQMPATTMPPVPTIPAPAGARTLPAPPIAVPGGGLVAPGATVEVPLPAGIGTDGVIFLRLVVDPSSGVAPDAVLSLREVGK
ncbi:MAG: hypothetical protein AB1679_11575 [Actinomycetota bacterium]